MSPWRGTPFWQCVKKDSKHKGKRGHLKKKEYKHHGRHLKHTCLVQTHLRPPANVCNLLQTTQCGHGCKPARAALHQRAPARSANCRSQAVRPLPLSRSSNCSNFEKKEHKHLGRRLKHTCLVQRACARPQMCAAGCKQPSADTDVSPCVQHFTNAPLRARQIDGHKPLGLCL